MVLIRSILCADSVKPVCSLEAAVHDAVIKICIKSACPVNRRTSVVDIHHVHHIHPLLCIEKLRHLLNVLNAVESVVCNGVLAGLALSCGHENDTVRTTCTVDSAGCSIFKNVDAFDVRRVERVDIAACNTVDNVERLIRADGTHTTD